MSRTPLLTISLILFGACAGPRVPSAFAPGSPASPSTPTPPRPEVAVVLAAEDPLDAPACADERGRPEACPAAEGGAHEHGGHQGHEMHPPEKAPPQAPRPSPGKDGGEEHDEHHHHGHGGEP